MRKGGKRRMGYSLFGHRAFISYPAHPQKDRVGAAKPFNRAEYEAFQKALAPFGDPELLELKWRVIHGVAFGDRPEDLPVPQSRFARGVIRVALRQLHALNGSSQRSRGGDKSTISPSGWRRATDSDRFPASRALEFARSEAPARAGPPHDEVPIRVH